MTKNKTRHQSHLVDPSGKRITVKRKKEGASDTLNVTDEKIGDKRNYVNTWFDESREFGREFNNDRRSGVLRNGNNDNNALNDNNQMFPYPLSGRGVIPSVPGNIDQQYENLPALDGNEGYNERAETTGRSALPMRDQSRIPANYQPTQMMNNYSPFLNYYKPMEANNVAMGGMGEPSRRGRLNIERNILPERDDDAQHELDSLLDNYMYNMARGQAPERPAMVQPRAYQQALPMPQPNLPNSPLMFPPYNPMLQIQDQTVVSSMDSSSPQGEVQVGPRPLDSRFFQPPPGNDMMGDMRRMNTEVMEPRFEMPIRPRPMAQMAPVPVAPAQMEPLADDPAQMERVRVPPAQMEPVRVAPAQIEPVRVPPAQMEPVQVAPMARRLMNPMESDEGAFEQEPTFPRRHPRKRHFQKDFMNLPPDVQNPVNLTPDVQNAMNSVFDSIESDELKYKNKYANPLAGTRKDFVQRAFERNYRGDYEDNYPRSDYRISPYENMDAGDSEQNELEDKYQQILGRMRVGNGVRRGHIRYDPMSDIYSDLNFGHPDQFAYENEANPIENYEMMNDKTQAILRTVK